MKQSIISFSIVPCPYASSPENLTIVVNFLIKMFYSNELHNDVTFFVYLQGSK